MRRAASTLVILTVTALLGILAFLHTPYGRSRLERLIESQAGRFLNGQLDVTGVSGGIFTGLTLSGVTVTQEGITTIAVERMDVRYSIRQLVRGGLDCRRPASNHRPHSARCPQEFRVAEPGQSAQTTSANVPRAAPARHRHP